MGFIYTAQVIINVAGLLSLAVCGALLGLSAWTIAYRFYYETWHGVAQIYLPGSELNGKSFKYTPLHMHMSPYYLTLAVACTGLFLSFSITFVNSRQDLHSRIVNHTFRRLPSTLFPATILLLLSLATIVFDFELDRRSTIFSPFYITTDFHAAINGTYTLDNFSCQLGRWLDGTQRDRTAQACHIGRITRFVLVPLVLLAWSIVFTTLLSMRAEAKRNLAQRWSRDLSAEADSMTVPSPYALHSDSRQCGDMAPGSPDTAELWSPIAPKVQRRVYNELPDNMVHEKSGQEILEKEG